MITQELKKRIIEVLNQQKVNYGSNSKFAVSLGISSAQFSRILNGELDGVLSDANWLSIARKLDVTLHEDRAWNVAETPTFKFIWSQLKACQSNALSGLLCDKADIGKTFTAKNYVKTSPNAKYIDCSQVKSKQKLIRQIAKEFGVGHTGKYADVYEDLVFYIRSIPTPLIILDEAGDLDYPAFLELKAVWNATEGFCGFYMMGADGLRAKIERNYELKKVGYTELFSRFGGRYQKVTPTAPSELQEFTKKQVAIIVKANLPDADVQKVYANTGGSLRRIRTELNKLKVA